MVCIGWTGSISGSSESLEEPSADHNSMTQSSTHIEHVSRDVHTANRLGDNALLDEKPLNSIREVARHRVAIPPIKVSNKDGAT